MVLATSLCGLRSKGVGGTCEFGVEDFGVSFRVSGSRLWGLEIRIRISRA